MKEEHKKVKRLIEEMEEKYLGRKRGFWQKTLRMLNN